MSVLLAPKPMKAFAAIFAASEEFLTEGLKAMNEIYSGEPDVLSPSFIVSETNYYEKEMGSNLIKIYASWPLLMDPAFLVEAKLKAMAWENNNSPAGNRLANLDPGYISDGGLVLSTGKYRGHRLYLGSGIWGELTISYHRGGFESFPWTYLDYKNNYIQEHLLEMRKIYMQQLRQRKMEPSND